MPAHQTGLKPSQAFDGNAVARFSLELRATIDSLGSREEDSCPSADWTVPPSGLETDQRERRRRRPRQLRQRLIYRVAGG